MIQAPLAAAGVRPASLAAPPGGATDHRDDRHRHERDVPDELHPPAKHERGRPPAEQRDHPDRHHEPDRGPVERSHREHTPGRC